MALLLLAVIIASATRPGFDWLNAAPRPARARRGDPLPRVPGRDRPAPLADRPPRTRPDREGDRHDPHLSGDVADAAKHSRGIKHEILLGLQHRLERLPSGGGLIHPAVTYGRTALEMLVAIFFTFSIAAYWIFEKERAQEVFAEPGEGPQAEAAGRDLGSDRCEARRIRARPALMITFVATVLSLAFWLIGLPYWLLIGVFAGIVEIVPVIGPLAAGLVAIGAGLTVSWQTAAAAAGAVYGLRLLQDYVIGPRVLGHVTGVPPLVILITVTSVGLLFGGFYVLLSTPLAAVLATLVDVLVFDKDPAKQKVPALIFPERDAEAG